MTHSFPTRRSSDLIFWEWHVGDDRVVVNAAANNLIGGNEGSIDRNIGWWLDRVHPDDHLSLKAASKNAFERREAEWTANFRLKTSRGRYIPVLLRGFDRSEENTSELTSLMSI